MIISTLIVLQIATTILGTSNHSLQGSSATFAPAECGDVADLWTCTPEGVNPHCRVCWWWRADVQGARGQQSCYDFSKNPESEDLCDDEAHNARRAASGVVDAGGVDAAAPASFLVSRRTGRTSLTLDSSWHQESMQGYLRSWEGRGHIVCGAV